MGRFARAAITVIVAVVFGSLAHAGSPSFQGDVLPILEQNCFECHGPGQTKGGLSLTSADSAALGGDSGRALYEPGDSAGSHILERVTASDADRMPPKGEPLTDAEVAKLRAWIDAGADWGGYEAAPAGSDHWAYAKPVQAPLPQVPNADWPENAVDHFVAAKLADKNLAPSPRADAHTLIRRLYLDLTGLPPTPQEVQAFVDDPSAYDDIVDRLLASPHYGERMALIWLDIARYADTNGYEKDRHRDIWPYREWVIEAFNNDKPYDEFVIEQLAGDLLPNATTDERVATGFLRNSMFNEEGGVDVEEFRYEAVVDRVNTASTAFLGLTMSCAQCHTHKYDAITQREYFQFFAFLNNTNDVQTVIENPEIADERERIQRQIEAVRTNLDDEFLKPDPQSPFEDWRVLTGDVAYSDEARLAHLDEKVRDWAGDLAEDASQWKVLEPLTYESKNPTTLSVLEDDSILATGDIPNNDVYTITYRTDVKDITAIRLEVLPHPSLPGGGPGRGTILAEGDFLLSEIDVKAAPWTSPDDAIDVELVDASEDYAAEDKTAAHALDGPRDTGWSVTGALGEEHRAVYNFAEPASHDGGTLLTLRLDQFFIHQHTIGRFRVSVTSDADAKALPVPAHIESILARAERSDGDWQTLRQHYLETTPLLRDEHARIAKLEDSMPEQPTSLALQERADARVTHLHHRGEYLSPREVVTPGVPAVLHDFPDHLPRNRLGFAQWLTSEENPLIARVFVNRVWQAFYGRGLVETPEDFGVRGAAPTHPELLDWLSIEFMRRGWSVKELVRLIVTSATYQQSSDVSEELVERDPYNQWLARGPRFRVNAETVRDIALASSGLLHDKVGGPSVYPPLPEGLLETVYPGGDWPTADAPERYRRGLYLYVKRQLPNPSLAVFDAPTRDVTCMRRVESNTPLQALTMLNDDTFMAAARAMGEDLARREVTVVDGIHEIFRRCLSRRADETELKWTTEFFVNQLARLERGELDANAILGTDNDMEFDTKRAAAWTLLARVILNLDETITKT